MLMKTDTSRRTFLGAASASVAAFSGMAAPAAAAPESEDVKLGLASYSFREFQRPLAIKMTKELNVQYINIKEVHLRYIESPETRRRARAEFERAGLKIIGGGTIYMLKDDDDDIRMYFDYAKDCGMPLMVIGPTAQTLPRIERFVKQYDIKVAIHNHGPEDHNFPSPESALKLIKDMDPRVGLCIDVGHTARTGTPPVEAIQAAGSRLLDMHIKDLKDLMVRDSQCDVGDGAMPIVGIFQELKKINYAGYVNLEYEINADDPMVGMKKSYSYMRGVLAGLRG